MFVIKRSVNQINQIIISANGAFTLTALCNCKYMRCLWCPLYLSIGIHSPSLSRVKSFHLNAIDCIKTNITSMTS